MTIPRRFLLGVGFGLVSIACHDTCPSGYVLSERACVFVAASTSNPQDGGDEQPKVDAAVADSGAETTCSDSTFGNVCTTALDCGCDTRFCAGYPGQKGICSHSGCLQDASVCPANWSCADFSAYQAGLSLCTPP